MIFFFYIWKEQTCWYKKLKQWSDVQTYKSGHSDCIFRPRQQNGARIIRGNFGIFERLYLDTEIKTLLMFDKDRQWSSICFRRVCFLRCLFLSKHIWFCLHEVNFLATYTRDDLWFLAWHKRQPPRLIVSILDRSVISCQSQPIFQYLVEGIIA